MSLFVDPALLGGRRATLQVPAGRLTKTGTRVTADPRAGVLSVVEDPTGSIDLIWTSGTDVDRVTLFKGDATVERVTKVTDGRVIVVDLQGKKQYFYWLQETTTDRDDSVLKAMKAIIEKSTRAAKGASAATGATVSAPPSGAAAAAAATTAAASTASSNARGASRAGAGRDVSLQAALLSDAMLTCLRSDPEFFATRLRPFLPAETPASSNIVDEIRNPQASSTAALLTSALQQPEGFVEIMASFGIPMDRSQPPSVLTFLQSLMAMAGQAPGATTASADTPVDE